VGAGEGAEVALRKGPLVDHFQSNQPQSSGFIGHLSECSGDLALIDEDSFSEASLQEQCSQNAS
jgi:hypothetical protein